MPQNYGTMEHSVLGRRGLKVLQIRTIRFQKKNEIMGLSSPNQRYDTTIALIKSVY